MNKNRTIIAGIDEAGYGPLLGPLVVSATAFSVPDPNCDMWQLLEKSVGKTKRGLEERLLVCDSKKAYYGTKDLYILEETVLAFLKQIDIAPVNFIEFLSTVAGLLPPKGVLWHDEIWKEGLTTWGNIEVATATRILGDYLNRDLLEHTIHFLGVRSKCLDAKTYNEALPYHGNNKANLLFGLIAKLIEEAFLLVDSTGQDLVITIDRLGGRCFYQQILEDFFPRARVEVINEVGGVSTYRLLINNRVATLSFAPFADYNYFPVALASMFSKYIREKILVCMNRYFARHLPGLKPTAGYWTDGLRFLKDLEDSGILQKLNTSKHQLIRDK